VLQGLLSLIQELTSRTLAYLPRNPRGLPTPVQ